MNLVYGAATVHRVYHSPYEVQVSALVSPDQYIQMYVYNYQTFFDFIIPFIALHDPIPCTNQQTLGIEVTQLTHDPPLLPWIKSV